jgi:hypothetical protein
MKLLMENWRRYLVESQEPKGKLLYHVTCFPPESFKDGIDPERASGFGQGKGFYLWTDRKRAVHHANSLLKTNMRKDIEQAFYQHGGLNYEDHEEQIGDLPTMSKEVGCPENSKGVFLVVVDVPITPENFDIDYEIFARGFVEFMEKNKEFLKGTYHPTLSGGPLKLGMYGSRSPANEIWQKGFYIYDPSSPRSTKWRFDYEYFLNLDPDIETDRAAALSNVADMMSKEEPEMFKRFEEFLLTHEKLPAVKYNGKAKIMPYRIETLDGKVVQ